MTIIIWPMLLWARFDSKSFIQPFKKNLTFLDNNKWRNYIVNNDLCLYQIWQQSFNLSIWKVWSRILWAILNKQFLNFLNNHKWVGNASMNMFHMCLGESRVKYTRKIFYLDFKIVHFVKWTLKSNGWLFKYYSETTWMY